MAEKENSYYILKAQATKSRNNYTFYKIGEADKLARPQDLCNKYTKVDNRINSTTVQLTYQPLPHNSKKRLNDKTIHKALDKSIFKKVDPFLIEGIFGETDGYDEFFEILDKNLTDNEIVNLVADTVNKLALDQNNFTAKLSHTNTLILDYKHQKHLVDNNLIDQIEKTFNLSLSSTQNKNILLIGQFLPDWIATFALNNNVVIWHDAKDQTVAYGYEKLNTKIKYVNELEEIIDMGLSFDTIISNPPYGSTGANITDKIRENINYIDFINLLPANDYKRNKNKDLFNYQSNMIAINNGFADAAVTTHCALIHKNKVNSLTADEFEIANYLDRSLDKYFIANSKRAHYAIDAAFYPYLNNPIINNFSPDTMLTIWQRDVANKHLPYKKDANSYKWNVLKSIDAEYFIKNCFAASTSQSIGAFCIFNTAVEKDNIVKFLYSDSGFRFMSKIFTALNFDSGIVPLNKFLPKVDWTRSWTVEEILAEYNYTPAEIQEIITDLDNFKGMN